MEKIFYYDRPTQVMFKDSRELKEPLGGIAYGDEIICMCCGGIVSIEEIYECGGAIIPLAWINLSEEVMGDVVWDEGLNSIKEE